MVLQIHDEDLAKRLQEIAARENRPVEDLLKTLLDQYTRKRDAFLAMDGMFDDDITDMSSSVRETLSSYYQKRNEDTD